MIVFSFRTKILIVMMSLVIGVTIIMLFLTDHQVHLSYQRHFEQSFTYQTDAFLQQREQRLMPIKSEVADVSSNPRLIAAMEIAGQPDAGMRDVDDLYQNGIDQLWPGLKTYTTGRINPQAGLFFFFLNGNGEILNPSTNANLPFVLPTLSCISKKVAPVGQTVVNNGAQETGFLVLEQNGKEGSILELVFTPVIDSITGRKLGALAVGFPLPDKEPGFAISNATTTPSPAGQGSSQLNGIWLENQLYSSSISSKTLQQFRDAIAGRAKAGSDLEGDRVLSIGGSPYQIYFRELSTGLGFPRASQVYFYSLDEAQAETRAFRQNILISGTLALLAALALGLLLSRSLVVPLNELVGGVTKIEQGDYQAKVPVRSRDELSQLASAFNDMAGQVQNSHLAQEQRIAERTQELSERKRAEEALRKSEARLREAQRIAHLGNWQWDFLKNELIWSDEIYAIFGLTPKQFGSTHEAFLKYVHPEDRDKVREAARRTLEKGEPYNFDHRILRVDGEERHVHQRAELVRDPGGQIQLMIGTTQDVTEQKRTEIELLRAQRLDGIGALAGGMAHDLNNALSPILMGIQLISRESKTPEARHMLKIMEANTHRGAEMVRQVLTFARGKDGEREVLDIGRLIHEMENIVRQTLPKTISVETFVPADLRPVNGNATQLHQVLLNLCVNARDAMPQGGQLTLAGDNVELSIEEAKKIPEAKAGSFVTLLVSDTGTGIKPEVLPRIFEPFFTTKGPEKGTGLGLSTISRIVRNHGGFIGVTSEEGAGTTFEIYLPVAAIAQVSTQETVASSWELRRGRGELILFIDDDRSMREMVTPALTEQGYRIVSAANGAEALALLDQHDQDIALVLTDFAMPVMGAMEMLSVLRTRRPGTPVILMSGTFDAWKEKLPDGVAEFLAKPFRLEQLLNAVHKVLHSQASQK